MHARDRWAPALALVANAFVWGVSWWPLRRLEAAGVHPLWATACVFAAATAVIALARPRALLQLAAAPALWVLVLASGATNAAFNWGVVIGDVVRVVLLFYLMPLWAVLLARLVLHEPVTRAAVVRALHSPMSHSIRSSAANSYARSCLPARFLKCRLLWTPLFPKTTTRLCAIA